jgi:hypothetical protein
MTGITWCMHSSIISNAYLITACTPGIGTILEKVVTLSEKNGVKKIQGQGKNNQEMIHVQLRSSVSAFDLRYDSFLWLI